MTLHTELVTTEPCDSVELDLASDKPCFGKYDVLRPECLECGDRTKCNILVNPNSHEAKQYYGNVLFSLKKFIKTRTKATMDIMLDIGAALLIISERKLWKYDGAHIDTFETWLKEIGYSHGTAYNMMGLARHFIDYFHKHPEMKDIEYSKVLRMIPLLKGAPEEPEDRDSYIDGWMTKASVMPYGEFVQEIKNKKNKTDAADCEHGETETFFKCKSCGKWLRETFYS